MNPSAAGLEPILDLFESATLLLTKDGTILGANTAAQRLTQRTSRALRQGTVASVLVGGADPTVLLQRCRRANGWTPGSLGVCRPDGSTVPCRAWAARAGADLVLLRLAPRATDPTLDRFRKLNDKIDQLAREVNRRRRAESLLASEKELLETVASGVSLEVALERLATTVEAHCPGGAFASILLLSEDGRRLRHAAAPRLPEFFTKAIDGVEIGPQVGSCGTAAHLRETVIATDIGSDPRWADYREIAARAQLRACWSTPVFDDSRTLLGTFALYYSEPRAPSDDEHRLVENAAHVASIAITRYRQTVERNRLLREAQLGREFAEAANRTKDQFIAMLGHELRNPLSAMMNASQALAMGGESVPRQELVEVLIRQGHHLGHILDDMLNVTRIDAGKLVLRRQALALDVVVRAGVATVAERARERSIRIVTEVDPIQIDGDPTRIEQVVRNLLDNAVKYGAVPGEIRIATHTDGDKVRLSIQDDGIGIDPGFLPLVFDAFSQAPQARGRSGGGVGLGLPLVKRLVELHGGTVAIHSDGLGRGTRVDVWLPLAGDRSETARHPKQRSDAPAPGTGTILIVEDHADSRAALTALLGAWGFAVTVVADGETAVETALTSTFSVALIDIGLPTLDGYEVARAIRNSARGKLQKLVAMSGYGQLADKERAIAAGFDAHLVKPLTVEALRDILPLATAPTVAEDA